MRVVEDETVEHDVSVEDKSTKWARKWAIHTLKNIAENGATSQVIAPCPPCLLNDWTLS